jgi:hypothetical protein
MTAKSAEDLALELESGEVDVDRAMRSSGGSGKQRTKAEQVSMS